MHSVDLTDFDLPQLYLIITVATGTGAIPLISLIMLGAVSFTPFRD